MLTLEAGAKSEWLDGQLRLNGSLYFNRWHDYQLFLTVSTPPPGGALTNLPRAHTWGGELEMDWAPTEDWRVSSALGVTRSSVREIGDIVDARPGGALVGVPEVSANALVARSWPIRDGRLTAQVQGSYTDEIPYTLSPNPVLVEGSMWLLDASVHYRFGNGERYEATLWGRNLGSTRFCADRFLVGGLGFGDTNACAPNPGIAFYGLTFRMRVG